MEIEEALQNLGLNEKQAAVYTALLQLGRASAYSVAIKSDLKKPTTYVVLDELIKKGLARKIPRAKKQLYVAEPPEEVFALAEERLSLAKSALPKLKALLRVGGKKVHAMYFEGVSGMQQAISYRLRDMKGKELVGFYAYEPENQPKEFVRYIREEWGPGLNRLGIMVRGIVPEHPSLKFYRDVDRPLGRTIKTVPLSQYSSSISLDTIGDIVRIVDYKNFQSLVIENESIAQTIRQIFEMVWKKY